MKASLPVSWGVRAMKKKSSYSAGSILPPDHTTAVMRPLASRSISRCQPGLGWKRETVIPLGNSIRTRMVGTSRSVGTRTVKV